jgi:ElaB/YqjD/DUF883 family membrane-anchored ribosome-binding protein
LTAIKLAGASRGGNFHRNPSKEKAMDDITRDTHLDPGRQRLATDLRAVIEDADALLRQSVTEAEQGYSDARVRLERSLRHAKDQLVHMEEAMVDNVKRGARATDRYVHDHPWQSVGLGAAAGACIGLLAGMLMARK